MDDVEHEKDSVQIPEPLKANISFGIPEDQQSEPSYQDENDSFDDSEKNQSPKKQKNGKRKSKKSKHKSTYDQEVFKAPQYLPKWGQLELIDAEPIKLTVTLKDIGLEGLDSYQTKSKPKVRQPSPPKVIIEETKKNNTKSEQEIIDKELYEQMRMKKVQEAWIERKKQQKKINTYDPEIFTNPEYGPEIPPKFEDAPPIKLTVKLKDIGLKGLDSFKTKKKQKKVEIKQEIKPPRSPPKKSISEAENNKLNEEMRMKKVQEAWKERKEIEKKLNTYSPLKFRLSYYAPKQKIKLKEAPPVKLTVSLKDIGLEGLDSYPIINTAPSTPKAKHRRIKRTNDYDDDEKEVSFAIKQPSETPQHSNVRTKRKMNYSFN